jgi:hypothetical protein
MLLHAFNATLRIRKCIIASECHGIIVLVHGIAPLDVEIGRQAFIYLKIVGLHFSGIYLLHARVERKRFSVRRDIQFQLSY